MKTEKKGLAYLHGKTDSVGSRGGERGGGVMGRERGVGKEETRNEKVGRGRNPWKNGATTRYRIPK